MRAENKQQKDGQEYLGKLRGMLIVSLVFLPLVFWLWPGAIPFGLFESWKVRGSLGEWFYSAWPIFAWAIGVNLIQATRTRNHRDVNRDAERIIVSGTKVSIVAGVGEEITFRWLFFLSNIILVKIGNFLCFGWLGFGLAQWSHLHLFGPLVNLVTFGGLKDYLFHSSGWAVGAAMLTTNAFFRDGHKYQGPVGTVNSWFIGLFLFWVMFRYGLPVAILIHFLYDFSIFAIHYVDAVVERARGFA